MINLSLKVKISKVLINIFCFLSLLFANAQEQEAKVNRELLELFKEWRNFEMPPLKDGVLTILKAHLIFVLFNIKN